MLNKHGLNKRFSKSYHSMVWALIFGTFISRTGFFMSIPFLGIYLHELKGYDNATTEILL
ncbi:hypothetical protein ACLM5H_10525 [Fredinandcohnia humi]